MPIDSSGEIKLSDIYDEFTGTHDGSQEIQMSDYRGDGDVPSGSTDEIQLAADMYGASDVQATPYTGYQITYGGNTTNIKLIWRSSMFFSIICGFYEDFPKICFFIEIDKIFPFFLFSFPKCTASCFHENRS